MTTRQRAASLAAGNHGANVPIDEALARLLLGPAVNQLFAATLDLSSIAASSEAAVSQRLLDVVDAVDSAIRQLRDDLISHSGVRLAIAV